MYQPGANRLDGSSLRYLPSRTLYRPPRYRGVTLIIGLALQILSFASVAFPAWAKDDQAESEVERPASVAATSQRFVQIAEVPVEARNVNAYIDRGQLPAKYRHALQRVR